MTDLELRLTQLRAEHLALHNRRDTTAIDVPSAVWLCRTIEREQFTRILELGSGFSTWVLRDWQHDHPLVDVWTIDDEQPWLEKTRAEIERRRLPAEHFWTFNGFRALHNVTFDLVFVDLDNMRTRLTHAEKFIQWTRPGGLLVFDDWHFSDYAAEMTSILAKHGLTVHEAWDTMDRHGRYLAWTQVSSHPRTE